MQGLCELARCAWCGLGEAKDSTPHGHSNGAQNTLGDRYGMHMPEWAAWCVVFSGSWSELGVCKKCCKLSNFSQLAPATTKNHTPCCPLRHVHPIPVPKGVLCTIGMSMWSAVFGFTQSTPCTPGQFTKSLHTHTGLTAIFPMDGAPLCAHHTPFPLTFCQCSRTQALPCMFQIRSHHRIWTQSPTLSPTSWSDSASTPAPEALLLGGWHTHWRPTTTHQLPRQCFACMHVPTSISGVGGIIISYENCLLSVVLMVKTCCHYCPDFYY